MAHDTSQPTEGIPAIETWWPELSIEHKQALKENPVLTPDISRSIAELTGDTIHDEDVLLSEHDQNYITTQSELVD